MIEEKDLLIDYQYPGNVISFEPINYDMWILDWSIENGRLYWWIERVLGFGKIYASQFLGRNQTYEERRMRNIEWKPVYLQDNCLNVISDRHKIVYGIITPEIIEKIIEDFELKNSEISDFQNLHKIEHTSEELSKNVKAVRDANKMLNVIEKEENDNH